MSEAEKSSDLIDAGLSWLPAMVKNGKTGFNLSHNNIVEMPMKSDAFNNKYRCIYFQVAEMFCVSYYAIIDGFLFKHRVGGPADYVYDLSKRTMVYMEWSLFNQKMKAFEYWARVVTELPQVYMWCDNYTYMKRNGKTFTADIYETKSKMTPAPRLICEEAKRLVWTINGEDVSIERYWSYYEQLFSVLQPRDHIPRP